MFHNMSMLKKGLLIIAAPLVFQVLFIGALLKTQAEGREAQYWALHTKEVITQEEVIWRHITQSLAEVRGYVVTGDREFALAFEQDLRQIPAEVAKLRTLVGDNPAQRALVDQISDNSKALTTWLRETAEFVAAGKIAQAVARVQSREGKRIYDALQGLFETFLREEEHLEQARTSTLKRNRDVQGLFLAASAGIALALAVSLAFLFARLFAVRVATLARNAQCLAEGKPLAAPLGGRDEIAQLDAAFHRMARTLAEREQENEMFIYSVSHDLRSPLVNLLGFGKELSLSCQDLERTLATFELAPARTEQVTRIVERDIKTAIHFIMTAVSRLSAIIDALLRLSRAGRVEYRLQPVDVESAVTRVAESLRGSADARGARITVGRLPIAWADPTAVDQIFANLLNNAIAYLDPNRPGIIEVGALDEPDGANGSPRLSTYFVKDNGLGIAEALQAKLFFAFQRLHPEVTQGEGIGLAVVRRVVERLGGRIWVESEAGTGTTFFVSLLADSAHGFVPDGRQRPIYGAKEREHAEVPK